MENRTQTIKLVITAIVTLLAVLAGLGLDTSGVNDAIGTLVQDVTESPSVATETPQATPVATIEISTGTPVVTAEGYKCQVLVRGDSGDRVAVYGGSPFVPDPTITLRYLNPGTVVTIDRFYIYVDVTDEYGYAPVYGGWIWSSPYFPAYDYPGCWSVPSEYADEHTPIPTYAIPTATPGPTSTPIVTTCEVSPNVGLGYVNVRTSPGTWASVVGKLYEGERATVLRSDADWYFVRLPGGKEGWVANWVVFRSPSC